jgi:hypothetical protein
MTWEEQWAARCLADLLSCTTELSAGRCTRNDRGVRHPVDDHEVTLEQIGDDVLSGFTIREFDDPDLDMIDDYDIDEPDNDERIIMPLSTAHAANAHVTISSLIQRYLESGLSLPAAIAQARKDQPELFAAYVVNRRAAKAAPGPTDDDMVEATIRQAIADGKDPDIQRDRAEHAKASASVDKLLNLSEGSASQRLANETASWISEHRLEPGSLKSLDKARAALRVTRPNLFRDLADERGGVLAPFTTKEPK